MREKDDFQIRREERQKKLRKKRFKRALIIFGILAVLVAVILCLTVLFPIKKVTASGSKIYSEAQIIKAASIKGKNLFVTTEDATETKLRKKLPLIDGITFERSLSGTVKIKVKDADEYAYYVSGGRFYSVSKKGYVMKRYSKEPYGLIKIVCSGVSCKIGEKVKIKKEKEAETVEKLISAMEEKDLKIDWIDVSNSIAVKINILGRFEVNFGTTGYLDKKISHLNGMINSIGEGRSGRIDLSMWTPEKSEGSFFANQ